MKSIIRKMLYVLFICICNLCYAQINNSNSITPITKGDDVDLTIGSEAIVSPTSVISGNNIAVYCTLNNLGSTASSSYVGYYLSTDTICDASDQLLDYDLITVSGDSFTTISNGFKIPTKYVTGSYYILIMADCMKIVSEIIETNNMAYVSLSVSIPQVDLITQSPSAPSLSSIFTLIKTSCILKNQGTDKVDNYCYVGFYWSTDTIFDASDKWVGENSVNSINGGAASFVSSTFYVPYCLPDITYYLLCVADYNYFQAETNELNNVSYTPIKIVSTFTDLMVADAFAPAEAGIGKNISLLCKLANTGPTTIKSSYVGYFLSTDSIYSVDDTLLTYSSVYNLSGATTSSLFKPYNVIIPSTTLEGNYYILFVADYDSIVEELYENNNVIAKPITVSQPIMDLEMLSMTLPANVSVNNMLSIQNCIKNHGNYTVNSFPIAYYLSTNATIDTANDIFLGTSAAFSIMPDSTVCSNNSFISIPSDITNGDYYIIAVGDYQNLINETNEDNNTIDKIISVVSPVADLFITDLILTPEIVLPGTSFNASFYLNNMGTTYVDANYTDVSFYLSSDSSYSLNDIWLANSDKSTTLYAGYSVFITSTLTLPSATDLGLYYIIARVDANDSIVEISETNNDVSAAIESSLVGITDDSQNMFNIEINPNPVFDLCNLKVNAFTNTSSLQINLYDITGQKVYSSIIEYAATNSSYSLDFSNLSSGMYFINIVSDYGSVVKKILVK